MRDTRVAVDVSFRMKPQGGVKSVRMGLSAEFHLLDPRHAAKPRHCRADQRSADAAPARPGHHADPADLARLTHYKKSRRTKGFAGISGQQMDRRLVLVVQVIRLGHALFFDKDRIAQGTAHRDVAGFGNLDGHAK